MALFERGLNSCTSLEERALAAKAARTRMALIIKALDKQCDWSERFRNAPLILKHRELTAKDKVRAVAPAGMGGDVPRQLAYAAHAGSSFVPDRRADQEVAGYEATMQADFDSLAKYADTPEKRAILEEAFAAYRAGYRQRNAARLGAASRTMSSMITGPARFPTERNRKALDRERARVEEEVDYRTRTLAAIKRDLQPERAPIMSSEDDATQRLLEKIEAAERLQERMKNANKLLRQFLPPLDLDPAVAKLARAHHGGIYGPGADAVRAYHDAKKRQAAGIDREGAIAALIAEGFDPRTAAEATKPDYLGEIGIPGYASTNNAANIRRMKERLEEVRRNQAAPVVTFEAAPVPVPLVDAGGERLAELANMTVRLEDDPPANRVRLCFSGKPVQSVRENLKRSGFRWAPSTGCWQAYRNNNALATAQRFAGGATPV